MFRACPVAWASLLRPARIFVVCLLVPGVASAERPVDVDPDRIGQLRADIEFLASDELRGRGVGDPSIDQAARFIADRMAAIGLDTSTIDQTPFQKLSVSLGARAGAAANNRVTITKRVDDSVFLDTSLADGMNPMAIGSGTGQVSGPLVFAGYGITAPKLNYDDYAGIDASGAIVIILRKEPGVSDPSSRFNGTRNTRHAFFLTKIDNAIRHGAAGIILVNDPGSVLGSVQNERHKINTELKRKAAIETQIASLPAEAVNNRKTLGDKIKGIDSMIAAARDKLAMAERGVMEIGEAGEKPAGKDSIPVVSVARDLIDKLLRSGAGKSLEQIQRQIDQSTAPQSLPLGDFAATVGVQLLPTLAPTSNVIGVLPGRGDLADQTIVVGAHYDHVGMGGYGSLAPGTIAVHNGADDNASGTAALLAIADDLVQRLARQPSHRRVVFIAFTGEERGLVGSRYYVRHPRFPLASTTVMVNLDMVGRLRDNELTVYGTGSGDLLDEIVQQANERQQFNLFKVQTGYGPSDHQSFYELGVPVLFFFTGLHNDYHRPTDDFDKIDFGGLARITDIVSVTTLELAIRRERPKYAETENRVQIRWQLTAFMGVSLSDRGDHVVLSGLTAGGPAQRGGLKIGDRLEKLADRRVKSASDVLELMRGRRPGDKLKVQVIRDQKPLEITIQLEPRPG